MSRNSTVIGVASSAIVLCVASVAMAFFEPCTPGGAWAQLNCFGFVTRQQCYTCCNGYSGGCTPFLTEVDKCMQACDNHFGTE